MYGKSNNNSQVLWNIKNNSVNEYIEGNPFIIQILYYYLDHKPKNHHDYSFPQYPVKSVIYIIYCGNLLLFPNLLVIFCLSVVFCGCFIEFKYLRVGMILIHWYQREKNQCSWVISMLSGEQNMLNEIWWVFLNNILCRIFLQTNVKFFKQF